MISTQGKSPVQETCRYITVKQKTKIAKRTRFYARVITKIIWKFRDHHCPLPLAMKRAYFGEKVVPRNGDDRKMSLRKKLVVSFMRTQRQ